MSHKFDLSSLNLEQREGVTSTKGPLVLLAGAGTGKTRVITFRIAYMISGGVSADQIVALTFTNKAAREMKERLADLIPKEKLKGIFVGTFHGFCIQILRTYANEAGVHTNFQIAATADSFDLVRKSLLETRLAGDYRVDLLQQAISTAKGQLLTPEEVRKRQKILPNQTYSSDVIATVYEVYERQLKLHRHIDFDDCIFKVVRLLRDHPEICAGLANRFKYFLIDEFQDTNFPQLKIVELLGKAHGNICVVGDDDQSIYSWRGAMSAVLERFEELFPERKLIKLEQNYRSQPGILNCANQVIKNNPVRKDKNLWSNKENLGLVQLNEHIDEQTEAKFVAEKIMSLVGRGYRPADVAILVRASAQMRTLEIALKEARVNYKVYGGQSFFERKEVRDVLAYMKLIANHRDRLSFWRIINTPVRGFGLKTLELIEQLSLSHKVSPFDVLEKHAAELPPRVAEERVAFIEAVKSSAAHSFTSTDEIATFVRKVIRTFRLESDIRAHSKEEAQLQRKMELLRHIPEWISQGGRFQIADHGSITLSKLLEDMTLDPNSEPEEKQDKRGHVSLMTIHAAKGLEFGNVFICGLEEGLLPHRNCIGDDQAICEERRLFYVAITRAKEQLFLSHCAKRGEGTYQEMVISPSRFIDEIPTEHVSKPSPEDIKAAAEQSKTRTLSRLSKLRESLPRI